MKTYKKVQIEHFQLEDVICSRCGKSCKSGEYKNSEGVVLDVALEFLHAFVVWGYYSPWDGDQWMFDLCIECCKDLKEFLQQKGHGLDVSTMYDEDA